MSANRKLQTEIQQCVKKVEEGVEIFDDIWEKVYAAGQQSLKEKYEGDLKKEIKKLQRLRDQIKAWLGSSEIKDKSQLTECRKVIESKMEQFKICEKDTKTKAYSKEGLARATSMDPRELEKEEKKEWTNSCLDRLQDVVDLVELEIEKVLNSKGGAKAKGNKEILVCLDNRMKKNRWHMARLEQILKLLENDDLDPTRLDAVREDVEYYIESSKEDEGSTGVDEEFDIYEELELDTVAPITPGGGGGLTPSAVPLEGEIPIPIAVIGGAVTPGTGGLVSTEEPSATKKVVVPTSTSPSLPEAVKGRTPSLSSLPAPTSSSGPPTTPTTPSIPKGVGTPSLPVPSVISTTTPTTTSTTPSIGKKGTSPTPAPSTTASVPTPVSSPPPPSGPWANAASRLTASSTSISPVPSTTTITPPPPPSTTTSSSVSSTSTPIPTPSLSIPPPSLTTPAPQSVSVPAPTLLPPHVPPPAPSLTSLSPSSASHLIPAPGLSPPPSLPAPSLPPFSSSSSSSSPFPPPSLVPQSPLRPIPTSLPPSSPSLTTSSLPLPLSASSITSSHPFALSLPVSSRSSSSAASSSPPTPSLTQENMMTLHFLRASLLSPPESTSESTSSSYTPRTPYPTHPSFPTQPLPSSDLPALFDRLPTDSLFFAFYQQPHSYSQFLSAQRLKKESWRYHKKYLTWFQRHEEPVFTAEDHEQGTYVYFDYESGWCQRIKSEFKFEYSFLEDDLPLSAS